MPYSRTNYRAPASEYAVTWGRHALWRLRDLTQEGKKVNLVNPTAFSELANYLEQRNRPKQGEFAPVLREFEARLKALVASLDEPDFSPEDQRNDIKIETDALDRLILTCIPVAHSWKREEAFQVVERQTA